MAWTWSVSSPKWLLAGRILTTVQSCRILGWSHGAEIRLTSWWGHSWNELGDYYAGFGLLLLMLRIVVLLLDFRGGYTFCAIIFYYMLVFNLLYIFLNFWFHFMSSVIVALLPNLFIACAERVTCWNCDCETGLGLHHGGDIPSLAHLRIIAYLILIHRFHFEILIYSNSDFKPF